MTKKEHKVMTVEAPKTTTDPKHAASSTPTAKHGCCGGEAAAKSANAAADCEHHAHPAPSDAAPSSCCGGANESRPADQKSRGVPSK